MPLQRKGSGGSSKRKEEGPKVVAPVVQQVYGEESQTPAQQAETAYVRLLGLVRADRAILHRACSAAWLILVPNRHQAFTLILVEGVFLGASGFLPDSLDQFAQDVVFKAFSPTVSEYAGIACKGRRVSPATIHSTR